MTRIGRRGLHKRSGVPGTSRSEGCLAQLRWGRRWSLELANNRGSFGSDHNRLSTAERSSERIVHVVDDDEAVRDSLAFLLDSAGFAARTYDSAESFLSLPAKPGGCLITDVRMPGLTGLDLMRSLRHGGNWLPVIMITGHADVALAVEAMKLGAMDFFEKPFQDSVLLTSVRSALAGR